MPTSLLERSPLRIRTSLVFRLPEGVQPSGSPLPLGLRLSPAEPDLIRLFFGGSALEAVFLDYLSQGFSGAVIHGPRAWAAYGWLSHPHTAGPVHLHPEIQHQPVHWLFAFQTLPIWREKGLYKTGLRYLMSQALAQPHAGGIYVDTQTGNLASRRGILSVGFVPCGVAKTYIVGIPKVRWWKWGHWDTGQLHPMADQDRFTSP